MWLKLMILSGIYDLRKFFISFIYIIFLKLINDFKE